MKFEVSYPSGTRHQVQLAHSLVVLGRDPGCDVVLNDTKCSRRHAVIEDRPEGLLVRDCGSANGIHVNGTRVQTSVLEPGDTVRLGDVTLTLMAEIGETVVVAPPDLEPLTMPATPGPLLPVRPPNPPPPPAPAPALVPVPALVPAPARRAARPPVGSARPLTVTLLVALWALVAPAAIAALLVTAARLDAGPVGWTATAAASLLVAALAVTLAVGLYRLASWARQLQIAVAAVGLFACPFTLAWATVLLYLSRPEVKAAFERRQAQPAAAGTGSAESTFALSILAMLLLGVALSAAALLLWRPAR